MYSKLLIHTNIAEEQLLTKEEGGPISGNPSFTGHKT